MSADDLDVILAQIDWVRRTLGKLYKYHPDAHKLVRSTLLAVMQSIRPSHPKLKRFYDRRKHCVGAKEVRRAALEPAVLSGAQRDLCAAAGAEATGPVALSDVSYGAGRGAGTVQKGAVGQAAKIPLTQGQVALVDVEDFEALSAFKWYAQYIGAFATVAEAEEARRAWLLTNGGA